MARAFGLDWIPAAIRAVTELIREVGPVNGVIILFFIGAHFMIFALYRGRIKDRQGEINRLADDNHQYRERFLSLLDQHFKSGPEGDKPGDGNDN